MLVKGCHFLFFILFVLACQAQYFQDVSSGQGLSFVNGGNNWGTGVSFFDFNEDGWDDLTICVAGSPTRVYLNNQGTFILFKLFPNMTESKQPIWFDYDNDGYNDLLIVRRDNPHQLYKNIANTDFQDVSNILNIPFDNTVFFFGSASSFGGAVGDPNRDGYLDISISNYGIYNGSANTFVWNENGNDFYSDSVNSFTEYQRNSFQSVWVDFDFDGYQELFIINDFYQGNEFYKLNELGVYTESSELYGLNYPLSSMSNSWCDFDNDGDLDLYISNSPETCTPTCGPTEGNVFLINQNGQYANQAANFGLNLDKWSWGALWIDVDNNGFSDLIVHERSLNPNLPFAFGEHMFLNTDGQFTQSTNSGLENITYPYFTSTKGDYNNDGKYDIFLSPEMNYPFKLLSNISNTSFNFLKFRLEGLVGNRNGFGTTYRIFAGSETYTGQLLSTESYLCQNSQNVIQGIGTHAVVDSMEVHWLSGVVDKYYSLAVNQPNIFREGETRLGIVANRNYLCSNMGDSILLSTSDWQNVIWENGSHELNRWVSEPGTYTALVNNGFGRFLTFAIEIVLESSPVITEEVIHPNCFDLNNGSINILAEGGSLFYSDSLAAGIYPVFLQMSNGCFYSNAIELTQPGPIEILGIDAVDICADSTWILSFEISGGTAPYSTNGLVQGQVIYPGVYEIFVSDSAGCTQSHVFSVNTFQTPNVIATIEPDNGTSSGSISISGSGFQNVNWVNSTQDFISGLATGIYGCQISYGNNCFIDTSFYIPSTIGVFENSNFQLNLLIEGSSILNSSNVDLHDLVIFDLNGKECFHLDFLPVNTRVSDSRVQQMNSGIYLLKANGQFKKITVLR